VSTHGDDSSIRDFNKSIKSHDTSSSRNFSLGIDVVLMLDRQDLGEINSTRYFAAFRPGLIREGLRECQCVEGQRCIHVSLDAYYYAIYDRRLSSANMLSP
jgi:hypothetical protein